MKQKKRKKRAEGGATPLVEGALLAALLRNSETEADEMEAHHAAEGSSTNIAALDDNGDIWVLINGLEAKGSNRESARIDATTRVREEERSKRERKRPGKFKSEPRRAKKKRANKKRRKGVTQG